MHKVNCLVVATLLTGGTFLCEAAAAQTLLQLQAVPAACQLQDSFPN